MLAVITGATGFLGRQLARQLLTRGVRVRGVARRSSDIGPLRVLSHGVSSLEVWQGDLSRPGSWDEAVAGADVVYHLAAALNGPVAGLFASNVVATRELVAAANRAAIGRLVLVGSLAVYHTANLPAGTVVDESCPLDPEPHRRDPYTYSKVAQEQAAREECRTAGMPLVVVRPGVIYGPGRDCLSGRIGIRLGRLVLRMGGSQKLPYTYVENCAEGVLLAGLTPGVEGEAFNLVDDSPPTASQLLRQYRRHVGPLTVIPIPRPAIRPLSSACEGYHRWTGGQLPDILTPYKSRSMWSPLVYSNDRAKARLGWSPRLGFQEGLRLTFDSLRTAPSTTT
jgi:nucleoside-diphosphate-sugar epimerase